jgi:hypothetical protein
MKVILTLVISILFSTSAFAGFTKLIATGESESQIPSQLILKKITLIYPDDFLGEMKASLLLLKSNSLDKRAVLSLTSGNDNFVYTLSEKATDVTALKNSVSGKVIEIDIKVKSVLKPFNILPLVDSMHGHKNLVDQVVVFDNQGYKRH